MASHDTDGKFVPKGFTPDEWAKHVADWIADERAAEAEAKKNGTFDVKLHYDDNMGRGSGPDNDPE
ncbi:MAG: hypothetical protein KDI88_09635 [Gammaproteobacteria bacterium]|nr:hypothetical protein [Gammaproteobacteria bacterium]